MKKPKKRSPAKKIEEIQLPSVHDWRTTDQDELNKRRHRARTESFHITATDAVHPVFSNFRVKSPSGLTYQTEIRDLAQRQFSCTCVDFRHNGLGTCKHVEATLLLIESHHPRLFKEALRQGSPRVDIVSDPDRNVLCVERNLKQLPPSLRKLFSSSDARQLLESPKIILQRLEKAHLPSVRISQDVAPWLESLQQAAERKELRRQYEHKVQSGEWPAHETSVPLFPYQREGMLHLAFTERALLADEMGLGKTIQGIAACALLHRLGKAVRVLVVTPASLKTEWEDQIQRFTSLPYQIIFGPRHGRLTAYNAAPFFTIVNYEQMVKDAADVNARLKPDIVILDEAQRIKNWSTQTAQAIKRLRSRYAFVLTGTPLENRIDEIHSIMDFLDPAILGPLFRFNREYYEMDDRGRPCGFRNLDKLHARIQPRMLRRRKADVETELPERTDKNFFVALSPGQSVTYREHEAEVASLVQIMKRRPLTQPQLEKLMREMAMMRMICDTNHILDPDDKVCPKLGELQKILEECCENPEVKVLIFSEWKGMLELVRELCRKMGLGHAWHTGSVPQKKRRAEILLFKNDPHCRVFLSTDSGSTGLNLQNASVVINCDLPWNPAKLEQRIARAWRKHQTRTVTVINLVSENTIESRMLETLASKQALADGVLELKGDWRKIKLGGGRQSFLNKLEQVMAPPIEPGPAEKQMMLPSDRALAFSQRAVEKINGALFRCEERYPADAPHSVLFVVVERDASLWTEQLIPLHQELFGAGRSDPLAPVMLEVIDRATDDALRRLEKSGLLTTTSRATRPLFSKEEGLVQEAPLSEEEKRKIEGHHVQAARKLKLARLLGEGDFPEEARAPLQAAILELSRALCVERRLAPPAELGDAAYRPGASVWGDALPALQEFLSTPAACWKKAASIVEQRLKQETAIS